MGNRTAAEAKQDYVSVMGDELGSIFNELQQRVVWLHWIWGEYVELFGNKSSRVDLLNSTAPFFFRVVHDALWESTILTVAKLTDPPSSSGMPNLTISRLPKLIVEKDLQRDIEEQIEKTKSDSKFCRDWRNRALAHFNLEFALDSKTNPLEEATRAKLNIAVYSISTVINTILSYYSGGTIGFGGQIDSHRGAIGLLHVINNGLKFAADRSKRLQSGDFSADDIGRVDI